MEELFNDERGDRPTREDELGEPDILESEVRQARKEMKRKNTEGSDDAAAVMHAGNFGIRKVTKLTNRL